MTSAAFDHFAIRFRILPQDLRNPFLPDRQSVQLSFYFTSFTARPRDLPKCNPAHDKAAMVPHSPQFPWRSSRCHSFPPSPKHRPLQPEDHPSRTTCPSVAGTNHRAAIENPTRVHDGGPSLSPQTPSFPTGGPSRPHDMPKRRRDHTPGRHRESLRFPMAAHPFSPKNRPPQPEDHPCRTTCLSAAGTIHGSPLENSPQFPMATHPFPTNRTNP
jgi:hypothetical protein